MWRKCFRMKSTKFQEQNNSITCGTEPPTWDRGSFRGDWKEPLTFRSALRFSKVWLRLKSQGRETSTSNQLSRSWQWAALSFNQRNTAKRKGLSDQDSRNCLSACHMAAVSFNKRKWMARPETCNQQLVILLFCFGGATASSLDLALGVTGYHLFWHRRILWQWRILKCTVWRTHTRVYHI